MFLLFALAGLLPLAYVQAQSNKAPRFVTQDSLGNPIDGTLFRKIQEAGLSEGLAVGTVIGVLSAVDPEGKNIEYSGNSKTLNVELNGTVWLARTLDKEKKDDVNDLEVTFKAWDDIQSTDVSMTISILDINDNAPKFNHLPYSVVVPEDTKVGTTIYEGINITDVDISVHAKIVATCDRGNAETIEACTTFSLFYKQHTEGNYSGGLVLNRPLDYEHLRSYTLTVLAKDNADGQGNQYTSSVNILINVGDVQDSPPIFLNAPMTVFVYENPMNGTHIGVIKARDGDTGSPRAIKITAVDPQGLFSVLGSTKVDQSDAYEAVIVVAGHVDRESLSGRYEFQITATELLDNGTETDQVVWSKVTVNIMDENDNTPTFAQSEYNVSVAEMDSIGSNTTQPLPGLSIIVTDADDASNANFSVEIVSQPYNIFSLFPENAVGRAPIRLNVKHPQLMDYEQPQFRKQVITLRAYEVNDTTRENFAQVTINLYDVNDNSPVFPQAEYAANFREDANVGQTILERVLATDEDSGKNGQIKYSLTGTGIVNFNINENTGEVTLAKKVDYERNPSFRILLVAKDQGDSPREASVSFNIDVLDFNDARPVFDPPTYSTSVRESQTKLMIPVFVQATDQESGVNITYQIVGGNTPDNAFRINSVTGEITLTRLLNYLDTPNQRGYFELEVRATDSDQPPQSAVTYITVNIIDENNESPIFDRTVYNETISEITNKGQTVLQVTATDADFGTNGDIRYYFQSGSMDHFVINAISGEIYVSDRANMDKDVTPTYHMVVMAQDRGGPPLIGTATVIVNLLDSNNKMPVFSREVYLETVDETAPFGTSFMRVTATDPDSLNQLQYSIRRSSFQARDSSGNIIGSFFPFDFRDSFAIDPNTGVISTALNLSREAAAKIEFTVVVRDIMAESPADQTDTALVLVTILGSVDAAPYFAAPWSATNRRFFYTIPEEIPVGSLISTMIAFDPQNGRTLTDFREVPGSDPGDFFTVDRTTGRVKVNNIMDYEKNVRKVGFQVEGFTSDGQRSVDATVDIQVTDMNDNNPKFLRNTYEFIVSENARYPTQVGSVVAYDSDSGSYAELEFSLSGQNATDFYIMQFGQNTYQGIIYVNRGTVLDHEKLPVYTINVEATDNPRAVQSQVRRQTSVPLTITVTDENDNTPMFSSANYSFYTVESYPIGTTIGILRATDKDKGVNGAISFSIYNASSQDALDLFGIRGETLFGVNPSGILFSKASLKGMSYKSPFILYARVQDQGSPVRMSMARIEIFLSSGQLDDGRPMWRNPPLGYIQYIPENTSVSTVFFQVSALPKTLGSHTLYKFLSNSNINENFENFGIDELTGEISVAAPLDRETKSVYDLIIEATDALNTTLVSSRLLTVKLTDVDDRIPSFMDCAPDVVYDVPETVYVSEAKMAPLFVFQARACDRDLPPHNSTYYSWYFPNDDTLCNDESATFDLNTTTGVIETRLVLDRETRSRYLLCVEAHRVYSSTTGRRKRQTDIELGVLKNRTNIATVLYLLVEVSDINDNEPRFPKDKDYGVVFELPKREEVFTVLAEDFDKAPFNRVRYTIQDILYYRHPDSATANTVQGAFNINPDNGLITINFKSYTAFRGGHFAIDVRAEDYYDSTLYSVMTVKVYVAPTGSRVRVVINADPITGKEKAEEMERYLNGLDENVIYQIDKVTEHKRPSNVPDYGRTDVCLIIVDNNMVLSAYEGSRWMAQMINAISTFGAVEPGPCDATSSLRYESEFTAFWWVLVAFAIFIFFACIICIIVTYILYRNYKSYMKTRKQYLVPQ